MKSLDYVDFVDISHDRVVVPLIVSQVLVLLLSNKDMLDRTDVVSFLLLSDLTAKLLANSNSLLNNTLRREVLN